MPVDERIHQKILHRVKDGIEDDIDEACDQRGARANDEAVELLNNVLLPAMKDVGDRFGRGELILPFVLQSAEVMKKAVAKLENYLDRIEGQSKGKVVLATVYGDVHDIGKSLVNTILKNNGYTTFDLGRQVPIQVILDKAIEVGADAIGLSALLVSTSKQMPLCLHELDARGLDFPVLIGGAAINRSFGRRIWHLEDGRPYEGGVFYCTDAFEGLDTVEVLRTPDAAAELRATRQQEADTYLAEVSRARAVRPTVAPGQRADLPRVAVPSAPFFGARIADDVPIADVWAGMDLKTLYKSSWGAKNAARRRVRRAGRAPTSSRAGCGCRRRASRDGWLRPRGVYGYFRCAADGESLVIFDEDGEAELGRLTFPRQEKHDRLAIPDYFRTIDDDERDVVAFQVVTVGREAQDHVDALYAAEEYSEQYFAHGLAIAATEGMAEALHRRVKRELGMAADQGRRYSWGYPACPDLDHHVLVCDLLGAADAIGDRPHVGVPARPGAVDGGDRRPPSVGGVLLGAALGPRHRLNPACTVARAAPGVTERRPLPRTGVTRGPKGAWHQSDIPSGRARRARSAHDAHGLAVPGAVVHQLDDHAERGLRVVVAEAAVVERAEVGGLDRREAGCDEPLDRGVEVVLHHQADVVKTFSAFREPILVDGRTGERLDELELRRGVADGEQHRERARRSAIPAPGQVLTVFVDPPRPVADGRPALQRRVQVTHDERDLRHVHAEDPLLRHPRDASRAAGFREGGRYTRPEFPPATGITRLWALAT